MPKEIELSDGKKVTMREPVMRDIRLASASYNPNTDPVSYEMFLFGNLCNMTMDEIDALPPKDYKKLSEEAAPFLS
ncbi:MAG: phage tail assembly protein [Sulfuricurvum sp.]|nr:phage tail assembly protein [Sulfuricurvum sp.]